METREERYWESFKRMYNKLIENQMAEEERKERVRKMYELYEKHFKDKEKLLETLICVTGFDISITCYKNKVREITSKEIVTTNRHGAQRRYLDQKEFEFVLKELLPFSLYNGISTDRDLFLTLICLDFMVGIKNEKCGEVKRLMFQNVFRSDFSEEVVKKARRVSEVRSGKSFDLKAQTSKDIKNKFNNACFKCGTNKNLCIDHHVPCKLGGTNSITNAVILCRSCNLKKHAKHPREFYSEKELEILYTKYGVITK